MDHIEVELANYRLADGSGIEDVVWQIMPTDGTSAPISLNPGARKYFRFVSTPMTENGRVFVLRPGTNEEIEVREQELGVKFQLSAGDVWNTQANFRLKFGDNDQLVIEPWVIGTPAVGPEISDDGPR